MSDDKTLPVRLRHLNACEPGCEGRCQECPDDVAREAADTIEQLREGLQMALRHLTEAGHWQDRVERATAVLKALS